LLASFLVSGSLSWLYYSDRLVEFPLGLLGVAIGTVILPHLSRHHAGEDNQAFSLALDWALRLVLLIGLPATLGLMLLAEPLVYTLFQYEHFSTHDAAMAARSLMAYSLGLPGFLAIKVLLPAFSARQDLATPARYGVYAVAANLLSSLLLVFVLAPEGWAHAGLALATSISALFQAGLLLVRLLCGRGYRPATGWPGYLLRLGLAAACMAWPLLHAASEYPWAAWTLKQRVIFLGIWIGAGAGVYFLALWFLGMRPRHLYAQVKAR
jgi:putative peptidoglycan lipid II flippase